MIKIILYLLTLKKFIRLSYCKQIRADLVTGNIKNSLTLRENQSKNALEKPYNTFPEDTNQK